MSDVKADHCPDCGKKIQEKRGSITQWIGLGNFCKCDQEDAAPTASLRTKKKRNCKRCLKPIGSSQSMTQWLLRKETCKCAAEGSSVVSTDYAQKAMSRRSLHRVPRRSENKALVALLVFGVVLFTAVSGYLIFDVLGMSRTVRLFVGRLKGNERTMLLSRNGSELAIAHPPSTEKEWNKHAFQYADQMLIKDSTISDEELKQLAEHTNLSRIVLKNCDGFTANGIKALRKCQELTDLSLDGSAVDSEILAALGRIDVPNLDLANTKIGEEDWSVLLKNVRLRHLSVCGVRISARNRNAFAAKGFRTDVDYFVRYFGEVKPDK